MTTQDKSTLGAMSRVCLGMVVLLERQVREALTSQPGKVGETTAIMLGMADRTAHAVRDSLDRGKKAVADPVGTGRALASSRPLSWLAEPVRGALSTVSSRLDGFATQGRTVADTAGGEAAEFLKVESDKAIAWARTTVIPPIVEDLANNDKIRDLVFKQALGAVTDTRRTVSGVASDADARVEAGFQRLLRRGEPVVDET
ncbi:hypothetical protein ACIBG8_08695 [Nonomuraea sp. NPDC050556]|uniref:hypothetical protein n=1 Tax=Nonomuraea sp. NPDC050556 TaxID=3364369 RepID=UPI0037911901